MDCTTWTQFCAEVLRYSDRQIRRLMEGVNPAAKYQNTTTGPSSAKLLPAATRADISDSADSNADGADDYYVETCWLLVMGTLRPLKSDSERFKRVTRAIAKEIIAASESDDEDDWE